MIEVLTRAQVREVDHRAIEDWAIPGVVLMENAGRGVAELILDCLSADSGANSNPQVAICCGPGNNGGDGFVIARHLQIAGAACKILLFAPPEKIRGDARINYNIAVRAGIPMIDPARMNLSPDTTAASSAGELRKRILDELSGCTIIVDALLGTGATGDPRPPFDVAITAINACASKGSYVIAVDLPSGLDCDSGTANEPTIRANLTATFVAVKPGLVAEAAKGFVGELRIVGIGVPLELIEQVRAANRSG